jgi:hypothetical protein
MPVPRSVGALNLNDRVQTFFDRDDVKGVRKITSEYVPRSDGQTVVTLVDKSTRFIIVYFKFQEYADGDPALPGGYVASTWEDYQDALEAQVGVDYHRAGGQIYTPVWALEPTYSKSVLKSMEALRPVRWLQCSIKLLCGNANHA